MKRFQSIIQNYITNHQKHKKYLAAVLALSVLVSFGVSAGLIEPAVSMTNEPATPLARAGSGGNQIPNLNGGEEGNGGGSPASINDITLLIGESSNGGLQWANGAGNAADVVEKAKSEYFLGIAYDFCVFLEENFQPTAADAEGRVAVGGSVVFQNAANHNYQIGAGDFKSSTALQDTDNYTGLSNFAHLIVGGKEYPIYNIVSDNYNGDGNTYYYESNGTLLLDSKKSIIDIATFGTTNEGHDFATVDPYKRIVVPSNFDINDGSKNYHDVGNELYQNGHYHLDHSVDEKATFYQTTTDLIDFQAQFAWLREQSSKLKEVEATGSTKQQDYIYDKVPPAYETPSLVLDAKGGEGGENEGAKTIYFNVTEEEWNAITLDNEWNRQVVFQNVPTYKDENGNEKMANLIINVAGKKPIIKKAIHTKIDGEYISANSDNTGNNNKLSENILYNFYEAEEMIINGSFNGTILAPNADVKSKNDGDAAPGHLSGALIAKSYKGGLEFGYRPYRGKNSDILGTKAGYVVPFDKFITGTSDYLAGASFDIVDESGTRVGSWTSGSDTEYATIPSGVDFAGKTDYTNAATYIEKTYTISETKAPTGYIPTDKTYTVNVKESINPNYLLQVDPIDVTKGTIPQVVDVEVTITNDKDGTSNTFSFQIRDAYVDENDTVKFKQRQIIIEGTEDVFVLNIDDNGKVKEVCSANATDLDNLEAVQAVAVLLLDEMPVEESVEIITETTETTTTESAEVTTTETTTTTETETTSTTEAKESPVIQLFNPIEAHAEDDESEPEESENPFKSTISVITSGSSVISADTSDKINNKPYYYDSKSIMVMPVPAETDTPKFENAPGLLFTKVDGDGAIVPNANIKITPAYEGTTDLGNSFLFDLEKLDPNKKYKLSEPVAPSGYELAEPIYFMKDSSNNLFWGRSEDSVNNPISLNENGYYALKEMVDTKITGAKVKIGKWSKDGNRLNGAKFQLCKDDASQTPVYPLDDGGFEIPNNADFDLFDALSKAPEGTYDASCVKNGYIMPGTYWLKELQAPAGYEPQNFKFRVKAGASGTYTVENVSLNSGGAIDIFEGQYPITGQKEIETVYSNVTKIEAEVEVPDGDSKSIDEVKDILITQYGNGNFNFQGPAGWAGDLAAWSNLFKSTLGTFNFTSKGNNRYSIEYTMDNPITIQPVEEGKNGKIQLQLNNNLKLHSFKIYGDASEGGGSGNKVVTKTDYPLLIQENGGGWSYTLGVTSWDGFIISSANTETYVFKNDDNSAVNVGVMKFKIGSGTRDSTINLKVDKLVFYYEDGSHAEHLNVPIKATWEDPDDPDTEWTKEIDLSGINTENVVKIEMNVSKNPEATNPTTSTTPPDTDDEEETTYLDLDVASENNYLNIKVPNQQQGNDMKVTVRKVWVGDEDFASTVRPTEITVQLKRDGVALPDEKYTVKLNADNNWTAKWTQLPMYIDMTKEGDEREADSNKYKYSVEELNPDSNYTVAYDKEFINETGEITITNTLTTKDIDVSKKWVESDGKTEAKDNLPASITVQLQWKKGERWENLKTLQLKAPDYTGKFENLPEGNEYQIVETEVPNGWTKVSDGSLTNEYIITNKRDSGSLIVEKKWTEQSDTQRPNEIYMAIYRTTKAPDISAQNDDIPIDVTYDNVALYSDNVATLAGENYTIEKNEVDATVSQSGDDTTCTFTFVIPKDNNYTSQQKSIKISNLNLEKVTKVEFSPDIENSGFSCDSDSGFVDWVSTFWGGTLTVYEGSARDFSYIEMKKFEWWSDNDKDLSITCTFTMDKPSFKITPDKTSVSEGGEITFTASMDVSEWTIPDGLTCDNPSGKTIKVKAGNTTGTFTIKATSTDGAEAESTITVTGAELNILQNNKPVAEPIKLHVNKTATVSVSPSGATANSSDSTVATVAKSGDNFTITAKKAGNATINFSRNGVNSAINVEVIDGISIIPEYSGGKMNKNSSQTLSTNNSVGDVQWEISSWDGDESQKPEISADGVLTTKNGNGQVTVKVTDNGSEAEYSITVELTAVKPNINGMDWVKNVTLTKNSNWSPVTVDNLPKVDENGNPYYYYVVEVANANGRDPVDSVEGNGAVYKPVDYKHGVLLGNTAETLSVENDKEETDKPGYTLPCTGGTGTTWYYITGMALIFMPVVILARRRKKST